MTTSEHPHYHIGLLDVENVQISDYTPDSSRDADAASFTRSAAYRVEYRLQKSLDVAGFSYGETLRSPHSMVNRPRGHVHAGQRACLAECLEARFGQRLLCHLGISCLAYCMLTMRVHKLGTDHYFQWDNILVDGGVSARLPAILCLLIDSAAVHWAERFITWRS